MSSGVLSAANVSEKVRAPTSASNSASVMVARRTTIDFRFSTFDFCLAASTCLPYSQLRRPNAKWRRLLNLPHLRAVTFGSNDHVRDLAIAIFNKSRLSGTAFYKERRLILRQQLNLRSIRCFTHQPVALSRDGVEQPGRQS